MIGFLRKNFPAAVTSETVKKFSLAPNNESYVINALQFIGVIDDEGKRTKAGHDIFVLGDDTFPAAFGNLVRSAYNDLFDMRGDDAWTLSRQDLIAYFRTTDKTSDAIGGRQAGVFQMFRALAGYEKVDQKSVSKLAQKSKSKTKALPQKRTTRPAITPPVEIAKPDGKDNKKDMALTVRIEINVPANGSQETYDNIFKSIRANLINE